MKAPEQSHAAAATPVSAHEQAATRPLTFVMYVAVVVAALVGAAGYQLRTNGIFGCPADRYAADVYLGYCNTVAYGDYDYGAFWLTLEPGLRDRAAAADVLFLGSSRSQFGFSSVATSAWFDARGLEHYLLGFSHTATVQFIAPLLATLHSQAQVYVINVDDFFNDRVPPPAVGLLAGNSLGPRYRQKRVWQPVHRVLCSAVARLCGDNPAYYRRRNDGHWTVTGGSREFKPSGVADAPSDNRDLWNEYARIGRDFVASLPVRHECVLLTLVPYNGTLRDEAEAIASALGRPLLAPRSEALTTFDGSHLDAASAERWSAAFLAAAGDTIERCVGGAAALSSVPSAVPQRSNPGD